MELEPIEPETAVELYLADREPELRSVTLNSHRSRLGFFVECCADRGIDNLNELTGRTLNEYRLWRRNDSDLATATENCQMDTLRVFVRWLESTGHRRTSTRRSARSPSAVRKAAGTRCWRPRKQRSCWATLDLRVRLAPARHTRAALAHDAPPRGRAWPGRRRLPP
jgi:hypothetical protein